jgi:hypothetical protein
MVLLFHHDFIRCGRSHKYLQCWRPNVEEGLVSKCSFDDVAMVTLQIKKVSYINLPSGSAESSLPAHLLHGHACRQG